MDPVTISIAVGVASKAFSAIKSGFAMGRDIEQMSGDIGRWMGAVSDVDNAEKQAKNPPLFGKIFSAGSIEEAAMAAYAGKKKLEEQRYELKMFLNLTHGPQAYDELLQMEGQIRKQRQESVFNKSQAKDYTTQQKIQKGIIVLPTMTTCRLKKRKVYKDKLACIYVGAQKTFTLDFTDLANGCPRKYKCVLDPNGKEPSIDSVMESLRSIAK